MIVSTVKGNLVRMALNAREMGQPFIMAHGCNCHTLMRSGIAGEISRAFPEVPARDKLFHDTCIETFGTNQYMLGNIYAVSFGNVGIINAYTQYHPGKDVRYDAIEQAFERIEKLGLSCVYIPLIGAGIAGGDWEVIKGIINDACVNTPIIVVEWDGTQFDD